MEGRGREGGWKECKEWKGDLTEGDGNTAEMLKDEERRDEGKMAKGAETQKDEDCR